MTLKNRILFFVIWQSARFLGKLPMRIQYCVADFLYVIIYRVVRYRVKITRENLKNSFPEKDETELKRIEKKFYKHLADVFIETIILSSISEKELKKRFTYKNIEVFQQAHSDRSSIAAMSHYGMWEYTIGYKLYVDNPVKAVYHPLSSKLAEAYYLKMRSRFGTKPVSMKNIAREIIQEQKNGKHCVVALIADQTPPWHQIHQWTIFLNQPTAFFNGIEKLALKYNMSVVFTHIRKIKRGYYEVIFNKLYDGNETVAPNEITSRYVKQLESIIRAHPEYWMWSHRRWKHHPLDGYTISY